MLHQPTTQPPRQTSRVPLGVQLTVERISAAFKRSRRRQRDLESELRNQGRADATRFLTDRKP
jgi:hypothetical protein